jgi:hypothetical protein
VGVCATQRAEIRVKKLVRLCLSAQPGGYSVGFRSFSSCLGAPAPGAVWMCVRACVCSIQGALHPDRGCAADRRVDRWACGWMGVWMDGVLRMGVCVGNTVGRPRLMHVPVAAQSSSAITAASAHAIPPRNGAARHKFARPAARPAAARSGPACMPHSPACDVGRVALPHVVRAGRVGGRLGALRGGSNPGGGGDPSRHPGDARNDASRPEQQTAGARMRVSRSSHTITHTLMLNGYADILHSATYFGRPLRLLADLATVRSSRAPPHQNWPASPASARRSRASWPLLRNSSPPAQWRPARRGRSRPWRGCWA